MHSALYGPHKDQNGVKFICETAGADNVPLWTTEPYLVISFVSGSALSGVLDEEFFRRNLLGYAKQIILQVGRILQSFHQETAWQGRKLSFVYQDLKPDNIMFTREKTFVLIDFGGFAVRLDGETQTTFAKTGTPGYQPPEFADPGFAPRKVDPRCDVFSLGATLYHVLTARQPAADATGKPVQDQKALSQLPAPWQEWVARAAHQDPGQCFQTMADAVEAAHGLPMRA